MTYYEYGPRRGGFRMRWILALAIALIGIFGYLAKRQINPVTGEKQYVSLSVDQEKALGLEAAPQMARQMGGMLDPRTNPDAQRVAEIGARLVRSSEAATSPYAGNFHFFLLSDSETINAFALPGGQIFITRGLYDRLQNEAQLAGVLGHEIGHVINRHAAEHMAKGELGSTLATAFGVGASDERGRGQFAFIAAQMANQVAQLKFSRSDETEADRYGLKYMADAGFDPRAMLQVMEILRDASKRGRQPEFLATHPAPDTRLEEIKRRIAEIYPNGVPKELSQGAPLH